MRGWHNEDERVTTVRLHVERCLVGRPADHAQVPVPLQHPGDHPATIGNLHRQGDSRIGLRKRRQHRGEQVEAWRATRTQTEGPALHALEIQQGASGLLGEGEHLLGILLHQVPSICEVHPLADALDQGDTQFCLQRLHMLADGGLADMQRLPGGTGIAPIPGYGMEHL